MSVQIENPQAESKIQNTTNEVIEANKTPPPSKEEAPVIKTEENQENWKKFREEREKERRRLIEAEERARRQEAEAAALKAALESVVNKPTQQQAYDESEETEDQRIEKKVQAALAKHRQQEIETRKQRELEELPMRLSSSHADFNQVCSTENLDYLEFHYPEVATPYKNLPDSYDKWSNLYKAVKRFVPNIDGSKEMKKAERNLQKPASMSSPGATQGGNAMPAQRLDDQRKAENWNRMKRIMNKLD